MITLAQVLGDDTSHLHPINEHHGLLSSAARDFKRLQQAAYEDAGLSLTIASSHRPFDRQLQIWNGKFQGKRPVHDDQGKPVAWSTLTPIQRLHAILRFSALPGGSRHHWGSDFDYYDPTLQSSPLQLLPSEYFAGGPQHPLYTWLQQHAQRYGFYFPYQRDRGGVAIEPWHLSHIESAKTAMATLTLPALTARLEQADIAGQALILNHLPELYERYVINVEEPPL